MNKYDQISHIFFKLQSSYNFFLIHRVYVFKFMKSLEVRKRERDFENSKK